MVTSTEDDVASLAHYMLGMELKFDGDRADAKNHLKLAVERGGLAPEEQERVQEALNSL